MDSFLINLKEKGRGFFLSSASPSDFVGRSRLRRSKSEALAKEGALRPEPPAPARTFP